jgi:voltage-gated potassium channel
MMSDKKKISMLFAVLGLLIVIDVSGYIMIENVDIMDAFYMTIISITTVGYREVFPLSTVGKMFTVWVIISGLGTFFYIAGTLVEKTFEVNVRRILGRRKMKMLAKMKDHVIVAGFGVMGEHVCRELDHKKIKFVIIENNPSRFAAAEELGYHIILGDATNEEILMTASAGNAKTFISLLSKDSDNIFTVMAIHELNPSLTIISRALDLANEKRLYKVGANRVVTPYELGARRIINTVLRPHVVDFIDLMTFAPQMSLSIEELTIKENSPLAHKLLKDSGLRENFNFIVIAMKRNGEMVFNPSSNHEMLPGDVLILVGEKEKLLGLN